MEQHPRSVEPATRSSRRRALLLLPLVLGVCFAAYLPVLENDFVNFDDGFFIVDNVMIHDLSWKAVKDVFAWGLFTPHYKPLVFLTWMTEYRLFGPEPLAFHLDNLLLHLANCALVFFLVGRLGSASDLAPRDQASLAVVTSLWFAVHPLHVESVAWAVERKDVLFAFFFLGATWSYAGYAASGFRRRGRLAASGGLYLLAVLSKSMAITFAVVPFLLDRLFDRRPRFVVRDKLAILLVTAIALGLYGFLGGGAPVAGSASEAGGGGASLSPLTANLKLWAYAVHLLVPVKLSVVYPGEDLMTRFSFLVWPALALTLAVAFACVRRLASRWARFWLFFYLATLGPALLTSVSGVNFFADRYGYVASLAVLCPAGGWLLARARGPWRRAIPVLVVLVAVVWGVATFRRARVWKNSETLWSDVIEKFPGRVHVAYINRGNAYLERGEYRRALADYETALEVNPRSAEARKNRGVLFARLGRIEEALEELEAALELEPTYADAYLHRAMAKTLLGRFTAAEEDYKVYLKFIPSHAKAHYWRGLNWQALGEHRLALEQFDLALALAPGESSFREARAESLAALGGP